MQATSYHDINILLDTLLSRMQAILGEKLVGLYLDGSLVIGDFDPYISDIDLVAALSSDIDDREFEELQNMHTDFASEHKEEKMTRLPEPDPRRYEEVAKLKMKDEERCQLFAAMAEWMTCRSGPPTC